MPSDAPSTSPADTEVEAEAAEPTTPTTSPGATRREIIVSLAGSTMSMTIQEIERAVGNARPSFARDSVEDDLESLLNEGLVVAAEDARRFRLTSRGERFAAGIEALAAG